MDKLRILGIAGSLRKGSYNRGLLRAAALVVPEGAALEIFELHDIPPFNQDLEADPPLSVKDLKAKIRAADGILLAAPEANYSVTGVLKNAIDWASRPYGDSAWAGKPVALMGATSGGFGTLRAQLHLRQMFLFLHMQPLNQPEGVFVSAAHEKFDANGNLLDNAVKEKVRELLSAFAEFIRRVRSGVLAGAAR